MAEISANEKSVERPEENFVEVWLTIGKTAEVVSVCEVVCKVCESMCCKIVTDAVSSFGKSVDR